MNGTAEIGALFRELRRVLGLSLPEVARMLDTRLEFVTALEAGNVQALPAWPDTVRIVTHYALIARVDAAPVLSLIRRSQDQRQSQPQAAPVAKSDPQKKPQVRSRREEPSERWVVFKAAFVQPFTDAGSGLGRMLASAKVSRLADLAGAAGPPLRFVGWMRLDARRAAGLLAALFIIAGYFAQGSALQASLATLHPPIVKLMRGAQDYLLHRAAPVREGLRWIEVDDPRSRRADKLASRH